MINFNARTISRLLMVIMIYTSFTIYCAQEEITNYLVDIVLSRNGSISVTENITYTVTNQRIIHGIFREIPTKYKDKLGANYNLNFSLKQVLLDNNNISYFIKNRINGIAIYIGDKNIFVSPGKHTYTISYQVNNVLVFFDDKDTFYWNVTGNGSQFLIRSVQATVHLPENARHNVVGTEFYTGLYGQQLKNARVTIEPDKIVFVSTKALQIQEGLTIAVAFPKGVFIPPTWIEKLIIFLQDNILLFWLIGMVFLLLSFYIYKYKKIKNSEKKFISIPLFHPPHDLDPSIIRYILNKKYDAICFAADLVNLGVHGLITITKDSNGYSIKKIDDNAYSQMSDLITTNLSSNKTNYISSPERSVFKTIMSKAEALASIRYDSKFFNSYGSTIFTGVILSLIALVIVPIFYSLTENDLWFIIFVIIFGIINTIFYFVFDRYTNDGNKIVAEINGFKTYLTVAEADKIAKIGTPPIKTPQLYEKYLPYAIALGVEQAWTNQFASLFDQLEKEGTPYVSPGWLYYSGHHSLANSLSALSTMQSSVNNVISSSSRGPGWDSGFGTGGGGGKSGGGSGGGGTGGW